MLNPHPLFVVAVLYLCSSFSLFTSLVCGIHILVLNYVFWSILITYIPQLLQKERTRHHRPLPWHVLVSMKVACDDSSTQGASFYLRQ